MKLTLHFFCLAMFLTAFVSTTNAQRNFTQYNTQVLPQSMDMNAAFRPKAKFYISLPLNIKNLGFSNSGFALSDLIKTRSQDDSLVVDLTNFSSSLKNNNTQFVDLSYELLGFGFTVGKNMFSFSSSIKVAQDLTYSKDLFDFVIHGNGNRYIGQRAAIGDLAMNMSAYSEFALGYNRIFTDRLTLGTRVKLISGIGNVKTDKMSLGVYTDPNNFDLTLDAAYDVKTSNMSPAFNDSLEFSENLYKNAYNFKNIGFGIDFGGSFKVNDKWSVNASVIDLGLIKWADGIENYAATNMKYTFEGVNLNDMLSDSTDVDFMNGIMDTISNKFREGKSYNAYQTKLYTRIFVGTTYQATKSLQLGATLYGEILPTQFRPAAIISAKYQVKEFLTLTVNHSSYANAISNIGFGVVLKGGPVQFFGMTDNVLSAFNPLSQRNFHASAGINLLFGKDKKKEKSEKKAEEKNQENGDKRATEPKGEKPESSKSQQPDQKALTDKKAAETVANDSKSKKEEKAPKKVKASKEPKAPKEPKAAKAPKAPKEPKAPKTSEDTKVKA